MSLIYQWSTVANANGTLGSTPNYWPEGQAPSTVNDCARLMMATIRTQWNDAAWFNWGYNVTRVSGTSFTVTTASWNTVTLPAAFEANARIKLYDTNTLYGTITTVSVSAASTLVTFTPDAHSLTSSFSSVYNSIIPATNTPIPGLTIPTNVITQTTQQIYAIDTGAQNAAQISLTPTLGSLIAGQLVAFKSGYTNTGATTLQIDALGTKTIKKYGGGSDLAAGDIVAGQIVLVEYDGTNWQMVSTLANAFMTQNMSQIYGADNSGTDSYTINLNPTLLTYSTGMMINFMALTANTGACTLNVDGLGAKAIKKLYNQDLATGDILAGQMVTVVYDGTNFEMQSLPASGGGGGGSSGFVKLSTQTASGGASIEFLNLFNASYTRYLFVFSELLPGTNNVILKAQLGVSGSYAAANYNWILNAFLGGSNYIETSPSDSSITLSQNAGTYGINSTNGNYSGEILVTGVNGTSKTPMVTGFTGYVTASTPFACSIQPAAFVAAAAYTDIKFFFDSGVAASGTVVAYGIQA